MNAAEYCVILEEVLIGATARMTQEWLRDHPHITLLSWPPFSPDLNPNEHVWAMMTKEWQPQNERSVKALEPHVRDVWGTIERRHRIIQRLVDSMPRRHQAVIVADGGEYTKY